MVIATGARCRTLPGTEDMAGVHVLHLDHTHELQAALDAGPSRRCRRSRLHRRRGRRHLSGAGLDVTMIDPMPTPLGRVLGEEIGSLMADVPSSTASTSAPVSVSIELEADDGHVARVVLSDGASSRPTSS